MAKQLRAAVDACQPDRPGSLTLQASLIGCLFQCLGIFHEDHMGEFFRDGKEGKEADPAPKEVARNQPRTNEKSGLFKIVRDLQAPTRLATEKLLADKLAEKLDVEGEGEIFVDRLFSFLAAVTTEHSDLRPRWAGVDSSQQLGCVDFDCLHKTAKELHSLGVGRTDGRSGPRSPISRQDVEKIGTKHLEFQFPSAEIAFDDLGEFADALTNAMDGVTFHPQINPLSEVIAKRSREREAQRQQGHLSLPDRLIARVNREIKCR
ncbi:conserved hypothetical protein [Neospora caninum Liverpool]|nr:conserved hypothetical protein [Neospora caninum Liverpool]CBZ53508.1 conserved hypothetical protein [Neospora caninum Liverpool]|eukprot:XP_003883540.1 conserved hypothetical protein [Neospora caninum Liverpool]